MEFEELQTLVRRAIDSFQAVDRHLLDHDLSERCIASRLGFHLQHQFPAYCVDVEYNRKGADAKRLAIPEECANAFDPLGRALVVPDINCSLRSRRMIAEHRGAGRVSPLA